MPATYGGNTYGTGTYGAVGASLTSISPTSTPAGTNGLTLTCTGTGFTSSTVVTWNGAARSTTFVSSTQVTAVIPASDLTTAGTATVDVQ